MGIEINTLDDLFKHIESKSEKQLCFEDKATIRIKIVVDSTENNYKDVIKEILIMFGIDDTNLIIKNSIMPS